MSTRKTIRGIGFFSFWGIILVVILVAGGAAVGYFVLYGSYTRGQEAGQHYRAAKSFEDLGEWDKAAEEYEIALRVRAGYGDTQNRLAEVRAKQKEVAQQQAATATAEAMAPLRTATAEAELAVAAQTAQAKADEATSTAQMGITLATVTAEAQTQLEAHYQAGVVFEKAGSWGEAKEEFESVIRADSDHADVQDRLAAVNKAIADLAHTATAEAKSQEMTATARAETREARLTAEKKAGLARATADARELEAKHTAERQSTLATATAEAKTQLEVLYQKGLSHVQTGKWIEAKTELQQVFDTDPTHKEVQEKLAEVEAKLETELESELRKYYQRGVAYLEMKRWDQAQAEFEKVVAIDPLYEEVRVKLPEVEEELEKIKTLPPVPSPTATVAEKSAARPATTPDCLPPPVGLVSWWPGDADASDIVGVNAGRFVGDAATAPGLVGRAFKFSGAGAVVVRNNTTLNPLREFTIDAWVNPSALHSNSPLLVGKELLFSTTQYELAINYNATGLPRGQFIFRVGGVSQESGGLPSNGAGWSDGGGLIPLNTWTHVALVVDLDGGSIRTHINGGLAKEYMVSAALVVRRTTGDLRIGNNMFSDNYVGLIDEVEFYSVALDREEIQSIYAMGSKGKCKPETLRADVEPERTNTPAASTPNRTATATARAQVMATMVAETLTAQPTWTPTTTPDWDATGTAEAQDLATAVAATVMAASAPQAGATWTRPADEMVMLYVPAGEFQMGSNDGGADEKPVHTVALDAFWLDRTEVSNAQYGRCVQMGTCAPSRYEEDDAIYNGEDQPVVGVSWEDAVAYCDWAEARLPTEAEWEYAARGPDGLVYPWGNEFDGKRLNWKVEDDGYERTAPVGSYPEGASWCGAVDMAGNVWEWVADWHGDYPSGRQVNPTGPARGIYRVLRGGSWGSSSIGTCCAFRSWHSPHYGDDYRGFRCARSS